LFFEGAEKKIEIIIASDKGSLLDKSESFWQRMVEACQASILSSKKNDQLHSYLLSESSLFVWKDRFLMLTCGQTQLINSVKLFTEEVGSENITSLIYQRKNEYRAELQPTHFFDDVKELQEKFDGQALRFGKLHGHYTLLYHLNKKYTPSSDDQTSELLMYDISPESSQLLTQKGLSKKAVKDFFNLEEILPGFIIDDYVFDPFGYSLNAIKGQNYYTIHVTPQETSPYVSFETNMLGIDKERIIFKKLIDLFKPESFDLISFNDLHSTDFDKQYRCTSQTRGNLSCGYDVVFNYFSKLELKVETPVSLMN
jgi:S-adenosylmethionine decarboxylase